ncbi:peroxisomal (S)-2-hydroxy-acid oxidase GLO4 isoform X1 [Oryza sativa Japonica Group]|uniref:Peroxisomal (S)-2-hydroxy-acid oxidase GLO4 n=1 Tax=Oryza sativa subsp. japonica TaxID=39947 RepID=HAOX_ORYSJ|nr:peroxisomal (S)-2-hydroxy-acid oxidase GLO4 [Oryza sativa Japonica Group]XP_015647068.1 peroxisomal (S)-2-hydroxy-acid oxidase GLO4 isoform X1 [Oryza sativa Japonica Group]XP_015647069.1 peroxisomal (S)-2-hydroxy-acid oxidase GLO4 isoform X1 [Oryza sativa Japonica Group]XP_015647070.1 peroxisomal (S)-2-hydroxy-acid oxidase GLO4 isoform X1 [Oryza sativa Japonica Group]Q8H3I4.2 RecName: Full=Peroxisomal (S)-2-hydroxy-acid oxidase GLO4; AltName: Full=Glycolate oxidase 4; Short=GOX 4; Short=OsGL|eukprot:NP_001060276.1 Os07g0616500 [Oryza sativa Japonica Group]
MEDNLPVNVREYQELAKKALPKMAYDYINGGAEDEHTLRENIAAYTRIILRPRVLVDVSKIDMSTTLLGYTMRSPIIVAPTGGHKLAHPEGEKATARAAASCNAIMVLSFSSSCKIEDVASSCNAIRFYQLYVYKNRNVSATLVRRAESCGFKALLLTVDTPMLGRREADIRNKMVFPRSGNLEGLMTTDDHDTTNGSQLERFARATLDPSLSWKDIEWLKSITSMPIFLKGIVTAEDARRAVEAGVAGVIVSNHGARQLDYAPATIAALEEVVRAVAGAVPVLVDGGIRRGTDVFKALALGARAVMVGRPVFFGLAARGEAGARHVIEMLNGELEVAMALCGCRSVGEITRSHVMTEGDRIRSLL